MLSRLKKRARRVGPVKSRLSLHSIVRSGRTLVASDAASEEKPREQKHTAIHNQAAIDSAAIAADRGVDGDRDAAKVTKKIVRAAGKVQRARMTETEDGRTYETADADHRRFLERFPWAVELLAKSREQGWKFLLPVLCAFGISFALDYPVMELLAPEVAMAGFPGPIGWTLENFPLLSAICVAVAEAAMVAYAGKEAAWAWSPFQGDPSELRNRIAEPPHGVVFSERGQGGHRVGFALLTVTLLGLLAALVALREKALGLLGALDGGGAGGLAGSLAEATPNPDGFWGAVELFVISGFPLLVAGWAAFLRESPLASSLADLGKAKKLASRKLKRATKRRIAAENRLVNLGEKLDLVNRECDADQFLAGLFPHMVAEVLAEASPEFYGVVSDKQHPLLWRIDESPDGGSSEENLADTLAAWRAKRQAGAETQGREDGDHGQQEAA